MQATLPTLTRDEHQHCERLRKLICDEIDRNGPITCARYIEMALYQPGLGYYKCGTQKFARAGDFITAPELSPLFAACLVQRCQALWQQYKPAILEIGAGSGILAAEIIAVCAQQNCVPAQYVILELSAELASRQQVLIQQRWPQYFERFVWLDRWPQTPFNGVVIANELFDAMPVHKFKIDNDIKEYYVTHHEGQLAWQLGDPSTPTLVAQLNSYDIDFAEGYTSEVNCMLGAWFKGLAGSLGKAALVFIDYGYERDLYYHPERHMGTLMCHFKHRAHEDPLLFPGIQDITTHVDFTLISEAAKNSGFNVTNFETQAQFLMQNGITDIVAQITDPQQQLILAQQLKQLVLPDAMGEAFKVIQLQYVL